MSRHTAVRIEVLVLAGIGLFLVAPPVRAQQGWPINGSNWSFNGGRSGGFSSYSPSYPSYSPSYYTVPGASYGGYSYVVPFEGYYNGAYANGLVPPANYTYGAYSRTAENVARIRLVVPTDAQVWFDDKATEQRGETRNFESPPLAPGRQYIYDVKVRWREKDGQEVTRTRQLSLSANSTVSADFTDKPATRTK
jgi:uncharacterized protein (TIGR03000 family)